MDFKELLETDEVANDVRIITALKRSGLPVVLYGASADVAGQIVKKLSSHDIEVAAVAFDGDSPLMTGLTARLKDVETVGVKDVDGKFRAYNVIPGFVKGYGSIPAIKAKFGNAKTVSYLSEIFDLEAVTPSFIRENREFLEDLYENFQDRQSKDSFVAYLLSKTRQDMKYLPPVFDKTQYFPKGMFEFTPHESYFDCGAFTGDTIAGFLKAVGGSYRHIWAAEPDRLNCEQLAKYVRDEKLDNIDIINKGIYSHAGTLPFQEDGSMLSMISDGAENRIAVDTIDEISGGAPVTYIKMDVEGVELQALKGAAQTIQSHRPVLGISIYHRQRDLIDIPEYVRSLVPEYRFYFRVHKKLAIDTVLYAVTARNQ
ncbi:MAG: FkbM family methyltransferase [Tannerella sp.]|jgi:FkbM family methyltransferase|nr:FkbM family methyltransferase [Tannerella sp.]